MSAAPSTQPVNFDAPATTWNTVDMPRSCAARIDSVPTQIGSRPPGGVPAVSAFEKVADGQVAVLHRLSPHPRADGERQDQAPDAGRPVPPPRAHAVAISEARGADRRARANVSRRGTWQR